jgi:hypothetical protein
MSFGYVLRRDPSINKVHHPKPLKLPYMLQPHFWKSVKLTLTFLKWGLGSLLGLSKLQSSITRVKTPRLEAFFMSLESY